jgi:hypothetical protein
MTSPEQERARIAGVYSRMEAEELEATAQSAYELSEVAQEALHAEIARRGLNIALASAPAGIDVMEASNVVTICKFRDLPEALLAKGSLDSAGITSYLVDDNMIRMDWFISNLLGGIKLQVHPEDVDAANEILNQPIPDSLEIEGVGNYEQPHCPSCQSLDVTFRELNKLVSYGSAYIGLPLPVHKKGWYCHICHHAWEGESAAAEPDPNDIPR